ncbi:putative F-box domain-containing protein [Arabidopsis thaliana]
MPSKEDAMNNQKNDSMDRRKIVRRNSQSSVSTYVRETLHIDLIIEIVSRLPLDSIAICRCVSKQWASILQRPDFAESFLRKSLSRPRLLFTFRSGSKCKRVSYGLFWKLDITSPKVGTGNVILKCFFGYDPIRKQFKVLCWTNFYRQGRTSNEQYQVLTLGTGELLWRKIECLFPHEPHKDKNGICINGVLYYIAWLKNRCYDGTEIIVCFDVRSEKFSFIEIEIKEVNGSILLEYKGKLGVLMWSVYSYSAELWVLDDTKNVKWSKYKFVLPYTASEEVKKSIWATDSGELVCLDVIKSFEPSIICLLLQSGESEC